ncbi:MAG: tRNA-intron lyase, partial [Nanoarchaeota archaeon]|nr:tRNA-intron lyase [Nanoarchaeota archaeon]
MEKIKSYLIGENVSSNSTEAFSLYKKSSFGEPTGEKIQYTLSEALFLVEKGKMDIFSRGKKRHKKDLIGKIQRIDKRIQIKYSVFRDLRERGYIIKTALKFGADFRVYDRGVKPGEDHAKWIVYPVYESSTLTWYEFAAKN